jgi:predicted nucleic acid-binding Zn ribbon protein
MFVMPSPRLERGTNGLCLPPRLSPPPTRRGSWSGLSLRFTRLPSSLYTFLTSEAWLGITVPLSRLRLPRIWQILRAHLRRSRSYVGLNVIRSQPYFGGRMEKSCVVCEAALTGRQTKFCSRRCKNASTNNKNQNYVSQQRRGRERRLLLIQQKGGRCERCDYDRNNAALAFHHVDPATKSFPIDLRSCSNTSWEALVIEAQKCILLCLNCHSEIHNPEFST